MLKRFLNRFKYRKMSKLLTKVEKVSKKIELKEHVVVHFPSRPKLTINCDGIGD